MRLGPPVPNKSWFCDQIQRNCERAPSPLSAVKKISKSLLTISILTITTLLVLDVLATRYNNKIIERNRLLQRQAEEIKVTVSQFAIVIIHNVDLGLRGYALFGEEKYLYPMKFAVEDKDSIFNVVEKSLAKQHYPLEEFYRLKDSINAYVSFCFKLKDLFDDNEMEEFLRLGNLDKGYHLWLQYERLAQKIYAFENDINEEAQRKYQAALKNNYLIQVFLLLISVPTLLVTAFHTHKKFVVEVKLRELEAEKATLLTAQNVKLEQTVLERTQEIQEQNRRLQVQHEEITAQNEEITAQNEELHMHREELAAQNTALVESKKQQLDLYTQSLTEKSEIISRISDELELLKNKSSDEWEQVRKFSDILNSHILTDEDWEKFKKTFEEFYPNFFASLRYRFPDITAAELRLSALIKINLSLKEAANALGISAESVKKSRYRLKKKIALTETDSLEEYIRKLV